MSNRRIAKVTALAAAAAFLATALALMAVGAGFDAGPSAREVRLVARDMAFYLPGGEVPNPTLRFAAGERIRIVLENGDPGMMHDLVAEGLGLATPLIANGGVASLEIRAPRTPGTHGYICTLHPVLMRGLIEVRQEGDLNR